MVYKPENGGVANVIGSAISQISGEIEKIYAISSENRDEILNGAKELAINETIKTGADSEKSRNCRYRKCAVSLSAGKCNTS